MRAIDAVEKITRKHPEYLDRYKTEFVKLLHTADHKEFKWHLAQLVSRLDLRGEKLIKVWKCLTGWAEDSSESKIVRVNSLQALFNIQERHPEFSEDFQAVIEDVKEEVLHR